MKRLLLTFFVLTVFLAVPLSVARPAAAVDILNPGTCNSSDTSGCGACNNPNSTGTPTICKDNNTNGSQGTLFGPTGIVTVVTKILSFVIGFLAIIFMVVQAIRMVTSGGDSQAVASARSGIIFALIGLVLAIFAQAIVAFVLNKVG